MESLFGTTLLNDCQLDRARESDAHSWCGAAPSRPLSLIIDLEHRVGNESVAVRHPDLQQAFPVALCIVWADAVEVQNISDNRIGVVDAEQTGCGVWHRAANVIEQSSAIGPIAADSFDGLVRRQSPLSAGEAILDAALAIGSVTRLAIVLVDLFATHRRAAALREARAVGPDIDIPQLDFIRRRGAPELMSMGGGG